MYSSNFNILYFFHWLIEKACLVSSACLQKCLCLAPSLLEGPVPALLLLRPRRIQVRRKRTRKTLMQFIYIKHCPLLLGKHWDLMRSGRCKGFLSYSQTSFWRFSPSISWSPRMGRTDASITQMLTSATSWSSAEDRPSRCGSSSPDPSIQNLTSCSCRWS